MCNIFCKEFVREHLPARHVIGRRVLEVGSYDVNGSCRYEISRWNPLLYLGVDLRLGPGVDLIMDAAELETRFGPASFDIVVCTEMLEHVFNWRLAIRNMKAVLRVGGYIALTTRSPGFAYHEYPSDFWRFTLEDMQRIFSEYSILALESDPLAAGLGMVAHKTVPEGIDLSGIEVYRMTEPTLE